MIFINKIYAGICILLSFAIIPLSSCEIQEDNGSPNWAPNNKRIVVSNEAIYANNSRIIDGDTFADIYSFDKSCTVYLFDNTIPDEPYAMYYSGPEGFPKQYIRFYKGMPSISAVSIREGSGWFINRYIWPSMSITREYSDTFDQVDDIYSYISRSNNETRDNASLEEKYIVFNYNNVIYTTCGSQIRVIDDSGKGVFLYYNIQTNKSVGMIYSVVGLRDIGRNNYKHALVVNWSTLEDVINEDVNCVNAVYRLENGVRRGDQYYFDAHNNTWSIIEYE